MRKHQIYKELEKRILVLDGGLGTMVQGFNLTEEDFRGERFADWNIPLKGCNDLLVLTRPDVIAEIHRMYLTAGADIITTDSFNGNAVSLADYDLQDFVYEINLEAARVARREADEFTRRNPAKPRYVSGSVGPTSRAASISSDMNNTAFRNITFAELAATYREQIEGLVDGGADIIQIETVFDTLNCKAALFAAEEVFEKKGVRLPVIVSGTLTNSGRTLSGQTIEAFYDSVSHVDLLAVGLNCSFGARQMQPYLQRLSDVSEFPVSVYPNAGLPNLSGGYDETPEMFAADVEDYMKHGIVNIVGGCCGTNPLHITELASLVKKYEPRRIPEYTPQTVLSGLESLKINATANFINVGERTNVAGSAKFAKLIREDKFDEALSVAANQVDGGAQIIDVCFDDGMIDGPAAMTKFLNMAAAEPDIARVPFMIDSSSWEVLEAGLQCVQGKSVVNSISLKEGEGEFLRRAKLIHRYGAAAVVMLFDERGQADTYSRKIEVAGRAYKLLTENGFPAEDIIFDPNVLAVATGIETDNNYGKDFIEACRWIKANLPYANISGGISNLSFAFRGMDKVRRAMHSVFLYHAIEAGLNMGIVNPTMLDVYSDIEPELLELASDVVLNTRADAAERLAAYAERTKAEAGGVKVAGASQLQWREEPVGRRIHHAMLKGIADFIEQDAVEAYEQEKSTLSVIDNMFMPAMEEVGELFGSGKMFLPQVVKTARVMRKGVNALLPYLEKGASASGSSSAGKVMVATVKGDVHDIGKNIVSVVMACNGYEIKDLGVMVETSDIVDNAIEWGADAIGLSALITPSLDEMIKNVRELEARGVKIPVIVGGATTSSVHTAVKIAPEYSGPVIYSRDASENVVVLNKLFGADKEEYVRQVQEAQENIRRQYYASREKSVFKPLEQARSNGYAKTENDILTPKETGVRVFRNFPISRVADYIDWTYFFNSWGIKGVYPALLDSPEKGEKARELLADAQELLARIEREGLLTLNGVVGLFRANRKGDDIIVVTDAGEEVALPQLRNQSADVKENLSLADYVVASKGAPKDYVALFALSAGIGLTELTAKFKAEGDEYNAIMSKLLADRLTEAFGEALHETVRRDMWGFETETKLSAAEILAEKYQGRRMAFGYPSCPDHSLKREVFGLLDVAENAALRLNDSYMIEPGESLCGMIFADKNIGYFDIGRIDEEQVCDYARRRSMSPEEIKALLPKNI